MVILGAILRYRHRKNVMTVKNIFVKNFASHSIYKLYQLTVNAFITSSLLICKVDIIHYCNIGCHDRKLEIIEE